MRVPVWIHNVASAYPGNGGLPVDDSANPFSDIFGKVNDGLRYQGAWDDHPAEIGSILDVVLIDRQIYGPQGIEYVPWGVVHGRWEGWLAGEYAKTEGELAAQIAMAAAGPGETPTYIVDLEPHYHAPFPAYWRDDLGAAEPDIREFVQQFRNGTNGLGRLWLAVDARDPHLEPVKFGYWESFDVVERILPMVYFTDFVRPRPASTSDALTSIRNALDTLRSYRVEAGSIYPIFPGDAVPSVMEYAIESAHEEGCGGVSVWQRGNLRLDTAEKIAEMDDPWAQSKPAPGLALDVIRQQLDRIEGAITPTDVELELIREAIDRIREEIRPH